ncbi:MAG: aminoacyl-tRNA hydrolase [Planctomycetota bacterium]|nr:aminoacyl-tRNA hydrolase [Planctomycetota bacterium]
MRMFTSVDEFTEQLVNDPEPARPGQELAPGVFVLAAGMRLQFSRGGGPGGQNVNKLNTKAELWISLGEVHGMSAGAIDRLRVLAGRRITSKGELHLIGEVHRTQQANRQEVFERLRELILQAQVQPKRRRKTRPSASSRRKRLESKRLRSEVKAGRRGKMQD